MQQYRNCWRLCFLYSPCQAYIRVTKPNRQTS
jgi:hypothetical protein